MRALAANDADRVSAWPCVSGYSSPIVVGSNWARALIFPINSHLELRERGNEFGTAAGMAHRVVLGWFVVNSICKEPCSHHYIPQKCIAYV
jgi:hypothetical protein